MVKKNSLIVFAGIVVAVAGGWWGINQILKARTAAPPSAETSTKEMIENAPTAVEKTPQTSGVVVDQEETAPGEITKGLAGTVTVVSGQTLVLEADGDRVQIATDANTKITRRTWPKGADAPQRESITLDQIQVGDKVDVFAKVVGGKATASSIIVIVAP